MQFLGKVVVHEGVRYEVWSIDMTGMYTLISENKELEATEAFLGHYFNKEDR